MDMTNGAGAGHVSDQRLHFHQEQQRPVMGSCMFGLTLNSTKKMSQLGLGHGDILLTQILGQTDSVSAAAGSAVDNNIAREH